jgi:phospholipid N-methyltransferase
MVDHTVWPDGVNVIEFGPGTGSFTSAIQKQLPPTGRFVGIEQDGAFVKLLRQDFPDLEFIEDSAANLELIARERRMLPLDHIVSGLPFASLPEAVTNAILEAMFKVLRPGGTFSTFQYLHAIPLPSARCFRRRMRLKFGPHIRRRLEWRNLPPAFAFTWRKPVPAGVHEDSAH